MQVQNTSFRVALTKFRTSSHDLKIERGGYHKPQPVAPHQRFCPHCFTEVEDEIHFLLVCPLYFNLRLDLLVSCSTMFRFLI